MFVKDELEDKRYGGNTGLRGENYREHTKGRYNVSAIIGIADVTSVKGL